MTKTIGILVLSLLLASSASAFTVADATPVPTATPEATATPAPTVAPVPTEVVAPCGPDGMPTDPTKPCLQLINPLQALNQRVAAVQQGQNTLVQQLNPALAEILTRLRALEDKGGVKPARAAKK